ncbi:conjugative transfer signal peptidase TraF [Sphingomonas zeicaulis]|uniref:S26 family signal peptidase n=1 Tax=Sphingomonas zeicaulis TaxID=1632740 RepID=UPI003D1B80E7
MTERRQMERPRLAADRRPLPRGRLGRRRRVALATMIAVGGAALLATVAAPPTPRFVWNASASAPQGLYLVSPGPARAGDMVVARLPDAARALAARRRYLPANVPVVKRVAAVAGDRICAVGADLSVNGTARARRRAKDPSGRWMPWWTGCRTLAVDEVLLLIDAPDSFDGRYFGPTSARLVVGRARLIWAR